MTTFGITSVQKASKKGKEKKNYNGKKNLHAGTHTTDVLFSFLLFFSFFFFSMLRVLECGSIFRRSASQ